MAILRGGRRIGNFDIRVGLPRDKSLVDIAKDPRLQRAPGGAGQIQRFQSQINQGEGFARPNRYLIVIHPPQKLQLNVDPVDEAQGFGNGDGDVNELKSSQIRENVALMCNAITLPTRDVNTVDHRMYGPGRKMPYAYSFNGTIECSFYGDKFLRQRLFFENWQKGIMNINSHNMKYYDDYVGSIDIFTLGQFDSKQDDEARVTYGVRLYECYPQTIGSIEYAYANNDQATIVPITLNFRTWRNLTIDQVNGATVGKAIGDVPTIKASKDFGLFSGILSKLPPEFRRAGRDILQTTRRNLPIGRVTGGRLFPPFG
tara:strand:+ start:40 stop:984 length:945 start_codon:yes stop_codon:yes gene_type:complete